MNHKIFRVSNAKEEKKTKKAEREREREKDRERRRKREKNSIEIPQLGIKRYRFLKYAIRLVRIKHDYRVFCRDDGDNDDDGIHSRQAILLFSTRWPLCDARDTITRKNHYTHTHITVCHECHNGCVEYSVELCCILSVCSSTCFLPGARSFASKPDSVSIHVRT